MAQIDVQPGHGDSPCVIRVSGDVDIEAAPRLGDEDATAIEAMDGACTTVVLDLGQVRFMDSTGLGALVRIHNTATVHDKTVTLRATPARVAKLLALTGLDDAFALESDEPVALEPGH